MSNISKHYVSGEGRNDGEEDSKMSSTEYKDSLMKMANTAISASKTGWTRARQVYSQNINLGDTFYLIYPVLLFAVVFCF